MFDGSFSDVDGFRLVHCGVGLSQYAVWVFSVICLGVDERP
jgi:hypothetical protein